MELRNLDKTLEIFLKNVFVGKHFTQRSKSLIDLLFINSKREPVYFFMIYHKEAAMISYSKISE